MNSVVMDGISLQRTSNSLVRRGSCDLNDQVFGAYTLLSALQGEPVLDVHTDSHATHQAAVVAPEMPGLPFTAFDRSFARAVSAGNSCPLVNSTFQEQVCGGTSIARNMLEENMNNLPIPGSSVYPIEVLRPYMSNDALYSSCVSAANYGNMDAFSAANGKANLDRFNSELELIEKTDIQPFSLTRNMDTATWMLPVQKNINADNPYSSRIFSSELSLSLTSSGPSILDRISIPDRCSEISYSGVTSNHVKERRLRSDQASCTSKEFSPSSNAYGAGQYSRGICGSKYLQIMQEILTEIASFSMHNSEQMGFSSGVMAAANASFSSFCPEGGMRLMDSDESVNTLSAFDIPSDPTQQKRVLETKKTQLLSLLQVVDDRYNRCLDEMHTVISAFHAATELDPQIHTRFVLQTISYLYKSLRARISNQILAMGALCAKETDKYTETFCFQEQRNIQQQLKKKDQIWRPQRGLPERSVSVLRAWLFQNFLHPYPKDAEKHLLAIKSGLTRSQVSNWFINARVRLWKPMIDEMYAEMNRRKAHQSREGANIGDRSQMSICNPRF